MERQPGRGPYLPGPAGRLQSLRDAGQPITPASLGLVDSGSGWGGTGGLQFCGHAPDAADPDFTSPAWIAALASFDALSFEDARLLLPHTLRTAAGQPFRKVPRLLTLVAALMPSPSGDAFAQLKDPEGQMCAALHRDVMEATEGQLGPRAVLLLQQVCVVSPCPGLCYLCVTADNVMKVFPATDPKQALLPAHVDATIMQLQGATHLTETEKAAAHAFQVLARPQPPMAPPGGLSQAQTSSQVHSQVRPTVQQPQPDPGFGVVAKSNVEDLASDGAGPHSGPSVPDCSAGNGGFGGCPGSAAGGTVLTGTMGQPAARKSVDQQHQQCQMQRGSHHQQRSQAKPASVLPDEVGDAGRGRWPGPAVGFLAAARPTVSTGSNASSMVSGGAGGGKRRRMLGLDEMDLDIDLGLDLDLDLCCDGAISNVKHQMQPQQLCPRSPLKSHNGRHLQQLQFPNQLQQSLSLQRQSQQQKGQGQWQQVQEPQEMPPPQQQRQQYGDSLQHHAESPPLGAQGTKEHLLQPAAPPFPRLPNPFVQPPP